MKKFLAAILTILYLSTSIGIAIRLHYCMGRLVEWSLIGKSSSVCGKCGMEKDPGSDNNCCRDECTQIKVDKDHKLLENSIGINDVKQATEITFFHHLGSSPVSIYVKLAKTKDPPTSCTSSLYVLNCVYRV